jgi:hypothetical protein
VRCAASADAVDRGIDLIAPASDAAPVQVLSSTVALHRALIALIDNALRLVRTEVSVAVTGDHVALVDVADDGPGIDPTLASRLFTRFASGPPAPPTGSRHYGLGLSLVLEVAAAHGGRVELLAHGSTVSTTDGSPGTVLRMTLPLNRSPTRTPLPTLLCGRAGRITRDRQARRRPPEPAHRIGTALAHTAEPAGAGFSARSALDVQSSAAPPSVREELRVPLLASQPPTAHSVTTNNPTRTGDQQLVTDSPDGSARRSGLRVGLRFCGTFTTYSTSAAGYSASSRCGRAQPPRDTSRAASSTHWRPSGARVAKHRS